jgi:hypothetical protein
MRPHRFVLSAPFLLVLMAPHAAAGEALCRPSLVVQSVTFSAVDFQTWRRTWAAQLAVDAASCATTSGRFRIDFVRLKEDAPDLRFTETFAWRPGRVEATTLFAADEAVLSYTIEAASCPCRR